MKEKLGLPDPRLTNNSATLPSQPQPRHGKEVDELIASITSQVRAFLKVTP
jgi:hypothetical protein